MQTLVTLLFEKEDVENSYRTALEINPHSVVICYPVSGENLAAKLENRLNSAMHPAVTKVKVAEFDLGGIQNVAENLFFSLQGKSVVLHYRGGTKPMSVGFVEEFRGGNCSLVHTDLAGKTMWWRGPEGFYQKQMQVT